ncbi:MAG: hypothetical protein UY85_C0039G0008 [Candidatus Peribacteria bacterium GW2011_GWB1_54_5]|nr:MAG: hypothetical protein UY85_C0039G0008 [Candidatus Peribacteria bacterium GW2011_GWB1_54_5]KKW39715.1 MAG: hypothetical protein UY87_C0037G0009 [Candidatus Peribacteria bacterium GW2011_GWC2_54_8]
MMIPIPFANEPPFSPLIVFAVVAAFLGIMVVMKYFAERS